MTYCSQESTLTSIALFAVAVLMMLGISMATVWTVGTFISLVV
jgi:hypothetical protein